jgi:hypothetical protein
MHRESRPTPMTYLRRVVRPDEEVAGELGYTGIRRWAVDIRLAASGRVCAALDLLSCTEGRPGRQRQMDREEVADCQFLPSDDVE